jgi:glycosyltransferase involved in cell wall biosynthesis
VDKPLISVVIPTYNRLPLLAELLESLSRQTFRDFEVIVVNDDGENVDVLKKLYPELSLTIMNMAENSRHIMARNEGVKQAAGEYIMLIDDDDLIVPSHMERMVSEIRDCDLVYADVEIVDYKTEHLVRIPVKRELFAYELDMGLMRRFSTFVSSGCLYRRSIHEDIGLFDQGVHNYWDWDFFLRAAKGHRIKRSPAAGVLYDFSDTHNNQSKNLEARKFYLNRLAEKHQLGKLSCLNFQLLLEEPEVRKREADSRILWDGEPVGSRLAAQGEKSTSF